MATDIDYHLNRSRTERDAAYHATNAAVSDIHMRLSALHLQRVSLLQELRRMPVGNVTPIRQQSQALTEAGEDAGASTQALSTCSA